MPARTRSAQQVHDASITSFLYHHTPKYLEIGYLAQQRRRNSPYQFKSEARLRDRPRAGLWWHIGNTNVFPIKVVENHARSRLASAILTALAARGLDCNGFVKPAGGEAGGAEPDMVAGKSLITWKYSWPDPNGDNLDSPLYGTLFLRPNLETRQVSYEELLAQAKRVMELIANSKPLVRASSKSSVLAETATDGRTGLGSSSVDDDAPKSWRLPSNDDAEAQPGARLAGEHTRRTRSGRGIAPEVGRGRRSDPDGRWPPHWTESEGERDDERESHEPSTQMWRPVEASS